MVIGGLLKTEAEIRRLEELARQIRADLADVPLPPHPAPDEDDGTVLLPEDDEVQP